MGRQLDVGLTKVTVRRRVPLDLHLHCALSDSRCSVDPCTSLLPPTSPSHTFSVNSHFSDRDFTEMSEKVCPMPL